MYILWKYSTPSKNSWVRSNTSDFGDHCTTNYTMFLLNLRYFYLVQFFPYICWKSE